MIDTVTDKLTGCQRVTLASLPTPLEGAPRLAAALGLRAVRIKREDASGYALGGNKMRQIDFILADALARGADMVVTTAGSQSNFCRSLAAAAAKLGLGCHLHLRSATGTEKVGNLLLDDIFGATVTFTAHTDPWNPGIRDELDGIAEGYRAAGKSPFVVQLTGVSANLGVAGWVSGAGELVEQFEAANDVPDLVVAVCGSGLSVAGLILGFKHLGCKARVVAISAQQKESRIRPWIIESTNKAAEWLGFETRISADDFDVIDNQIGEAYGVPTLASIAAVRLAGRTEGLVLDPIYSGKGLAGVQAEAAAGRIDAGKSIVFVHSGGTPGLFAHAAGF